MLKSQYLHGFHDVGGEYLHGDKPGKTLITEAIGINPNAAFGGSYVDLANRGIDVIVRLNNGYGSVGTIPHVRDYVAFAATAANWVRNSRGCHIWVIGNEPNHENERPDGLLIQPEEYATCFSLCRREIKRIQPHAIVIPAPIAPYHGNPINCIHYLVAMLLEIERLGGCDGIGIHAYTRGANPDSIASRATMGGILSNQYSGFLTYRDQLDAVPQSMRKLPAFILEFDEYDSWVDQNTGVVRSAYAEIANWNIAVGTQKIHCLLLYRWSDADENQKWQISNKNGVIEDFKQAVAIGFRSPSLASPSPSPSNPPVPERPSIVSMPRQWDSNLDRRGVRISTPTALIPGQKYWRVVKGEWITDRRLGGDRHIYVDTLDINGNRVAGIQLIVTWPSGEHIITSEAKPGEAASANFPMSPSLNEFSIQVAGTFSEKVTGIGMGADGNPGIHTSTFLVFQETIVQSQTNPTPEPEDEPDTPIDEDDDEIGDPPVVPVPVPNVPGRVALIWPTAARRSQRWGENPDWYREKLGIPYHNGIDHGASNGTPVVAMADGEVMYAGTDSGYGNYIRIYHPHLGVHSFVAHLSRIVASVGQQVKQGDTVAFSGATGLNMSTPPAAHTHTELRLGDRDAYVEGTFGHGKGRVDPETVVYLANKLVESINLRVNQPSQPRQSLTSKQMWEKAWPIVLDIEGQGQLSTDRQDKGNYRPDGTFVGTRWGISALSHPTVDVLNLSKEQALDIYYHKYWLESGADKLSWPLALVHFDAYVQNKVAATRLLAESRDNPYIYLAKRINWYTTASTWNVHGAGWMRLRIANLLIIVTEELGYA